MASQWLTLLGTIWLQSINGTNTNFAAYSSELKRILSISQIQLNNLAFASDAGKLLGWVSGIAAAQLPLWLVLFIGSTLGLIGYGVQFLFVTNRVPSLSYWHIFSLTVLAGNSICWINTVCYVIAIKNFPLDRQTAIGLSTSYVGLSAKIYTGIVDVIAPPTSSSERAKMFLLSNSVVPLLVCIVAAPLSREVDVGKFRKLDGRLLALFMIATITGFFAVFTSCVSGFSKLLPPLVVLVGMFVLLLLPLVIPVGEKVRETMQQKCSIRVHEESFAVACALEVEEHEESERDLVDFGGEEIEPKLMMRRVEFWLYFFVYMFGATLGLVYLNNLGQIAESRGCSGTSSLVSLSSAFSFFGRLLPSVLDYFCKSNGVVSRPALMGVTMAPMSGAFSLLIISPHDFSLYVSTAIVGISTGAITSLSVSTTAELFGAKNFGINHNILVSNIPIGSFLFGDFAALLYRRGRVDGAENCMGDICYHTTFMVWASLCVVGTLLAFMLHSRTKRL